MELSHMGRALRTAVIFALAGCGAAGTTSSVPSGAMTQSWAHQMSGSSGDLLYVAVGRTDVFVFSYPEVKLVGDLSVSEAWGLCSDKNGNVFVTEDSGVLEYAHGGTSPINTLSAHGAYSCSWDPSTGNLAVVERPFSIAIFKGANGTPQTYTDTSFLHFSYCAYDGKSNLFVTGEPTGPYSYALAELDIGSGSFKTITLNKKLDYLEDLQWDGKYLAIDDFYGTGTINRVQVSGSSGTIESTTSLGGAQFYGYWTWLQDGTFISPIYTGGQGKKMGFWSYSSGGKPTKKLPRSDFKSNGPIRGITVSVAPFRPRIHK
jgi:hypothetical protein